MNELMQALMQVKNPNLQDIESMQHPVTAEGWSNYAKGIPAGIAGIPGDTAGLISALMQGKRGIPPQAMDFDSGFGTDALGRAMGADVESPQFMMGSIGLPGLEDLARVGGAQAIFAGIKSLDKMGDAAVSTSHGMKGADELREALTKAKEAQGPYHPFDGSYVDTWDETGWFKGADDKWRYEIDDSKARMSYNARSGIKDYGVRHQGSVLEHDNLYAAYPDTETIPVFQIGRDDRGSAGSYYEGNGVDEFETLKLNLLDFASDPEVKKINMHELQHAIQQREGFARGGSPSQFMQQDDAALARDALSWRKEVQKYIDKNDVDWGAAEYEVSKLYKEMEMEDWIPSPKAQGVAFNKTDNPDKNLEQLVELYRLDKQATVPTPTQMYHRLAGEVEAGNVENRIKMTPEQRKIMNPLMTENTPRSDQIVRFR